MTGDLWTDLLGARKSMADTHKKWLHDMLNKDYIIPDKFDKNGCYKY